MNDTGANTVEGPSMESVVWGQLSWQVFDAEIITMQ